MQVIEEARKLALETAGEAAALLLENFKKDASLAGKRGVAKEISTKYDDESNALIIKKISAAFPNHNLLTEESGFIDKSGEYTWIIDSLDGTTNYADGNPFFSVSIALAKGDELLLGVINAPFLKEVFFVEKGGGAFLNGSRIRVSEVVDLSKSYIVACEGGEKTNARIAAINACLHPRVKDLRKLGSAALEGAWVACGRAEAYVTTQICAWDVAAAALLVREAGGRVTDFKGKNWVPVKSDAVFSNGLLHGELLKVFDELKP